MAWVAVDKDGTEWICEDKPLREPLFDDGYTFDSAWVAGSDQVQLPKGSIFKLIGRELTWNDNPVELKL